MSVDSYQDKKKMLLKAIWGDAVKTVESTGENIRHHLEKRGAAKNGFSLPRPFDETQEITQTYYEEKPNIFPEERYGRRGLYLMIKGSLRTLNVLNGETPTTRQFELEATRALHEIWNEALDFSVKKWEKAHNEELTSVVAEVPDAKTANKFHLVSYYAVTDTGNPHPGIPQPPVIHDGQHPVAGVFDLNAYTSAGPVQ